MASVRYDSYKFQKYRKDARGFLRVPARPTKAGVFTYRKADGSVVRELRPESEVFHSDSLETLEHAPITVRHPDKPVGPSNIKELGIGRVIGTPRRDGYFVSTTVIVEDEEAIKRVDSKEDCELSCGYICDVVEQSGTWNGERYDAIQKNIRYNHIGLGPKGWGRGGSEVSLRLDSNEAVLVDESTEKVIKMATIRFDGVEYEAPDQTITIFKREIEKRDSKIQELETRADKAEAERDIAKSDLAKANDPKTRQDAVHARVTLERNAAKILGEEEKLDNLSDHEIRCKAVSKADSNLSIEGKSEVYVEALFDAAVSSVDNTDKGLKKTASITSKIEEKKDEKDPFEGRRNAHLNFMKGVN